MMKTFLILVLLCVAVHCQWPPGREGCMLNGISYRAGAVPFRHLCVRLYCGDRGQWITDDAVKPKCDQCRASNDPHFTTFDGDTFDWHGRCRYSLVEHVQDWALGLSNPQPPNFAVYSKFKACPGTPSCHEVTSYQTSAAWGDVVHVYNDDTGKPITEIFDGITPVGPAIMTATPVLTPVPGHPLFARQIIVETYKCVRLYGENLLVHICPNIVRVWTDPINLEKLGGLCGKYDHDGGTNDQTERDDTFPSASTKQFALSWGVVYPWLQFNESCYCDPDAEITSERPRHNPENKILCRNKLADCNAPETILRGLIDNCVRDLDFLPRQKQKWLDVALDICSEEVALARPHCLKCLPTLPPREAHVEGK